MKQNFLILFLIFCMFYFGNAFGQPAEGGHKTANFKYISPKPGSKYIMPANNIALRHGDKLDKETFAAFELQVAGSMSGTIDGKIVLSDDERTILFYPEQPFHMGERVYVKSAGMLETDSDLSLQPVEFFFDVTSMIPEMPENYTAEQEFLSHQAHFPNHRSNYTPVNKSTKDNDLPEDFPDLSAEVLNETFDNGYYFVSPFGYWGWFPDNIPYVIIFDDHAVPVFYQKLAQHGYDLKWNPNGLLSYFFNEWPEPYYRIMDDSYNVVNIITMQNGYLTDFHEFFMLENGHCFIMAYDPQIVDMSQIVPGGVEDAIVIGWVFQELDVNQNVVFQWRSWDHYDILDSEGFVNLTSSTIDLVHGNSIEVTDDNALLLSPRDLNEITKIDRNTGEIIWRLNGNNNMFEFINDTILFSGQHDCRVLANGNLSIFDNGTFIPEPQYSSMVEYEIDEENFTATLVRRLQNDPDIFGEIMGSARELQNGNILAGWGSGVPALTEFDSDGNVASTYYFSGINYRAYRFPWTTKYFSVDTEELNYGYIWMEDQETKTVKVTNNQEVDIVITSHHFRGDKFMLEDELPVNIPAGGEVSLQVTFVPGEEGSFSDVLTLNSDINSETLVRRIAQQVQLTGHATQGQGIGDGINMGVTLSPNPVKDQLKLSFEELQKEVHISITDATGKQVLQGSHAGITSCTIDMGYLERGLYFMELRNAEMERTGMLKIIKE